MSIDQLSWIFSQFAAIVCANVYKRMYYKWIVNPHAYMPNNHSLQLEKASFPLLAVSSRENGADKI